MLYFHIYFNAQAAKGIGDWKGIIEVLSIVSVGVNCGIIYWTSDTLPTILDYKYSILDSFMLIVMIEHIIIALKMLISILIKDKPNWVTNEEHHGME